MPRQIVECRKLTVPQLAKQWGVAPKKVLAFVYAGELLATNLASDREGRPRFAIDVADIEAFELHRQAVPMPANHHQRLRRRAASTIKQFV